MKGTNALQSLAIFAVLTAAFALGPIIADENIAHASQPVGSGVHPAFTPLPTPPGPAGPTRAQLQTEINNLTKTVNSLKAAYNSHCHQMPGLNFVTYTAGSNVSPGPGGGNEYHFVVTPSAGAGSYGWRKTSGPSSC
jgi:hypothetical protein